MVRGVNLKLLKTICMLIMLELDDLSLDNLMQSYPARALGRRLQVDWARDPREGPRVDFESMGQGWINSSL